MCAPPPTAQRNEKIRRALRPFSIAVVAAMLLMQLSYAHAQTSGPTGPSQKEKAKVREKRASEKDIDEAYKSTMKQIPDAKQKVDPWGSIRTAPQK